LGLWAEGSIIGQLATHQVRFEREVIERRTGRQAAEGEKSELEKGWMSGAGMPEKAQPQLTVGILQRDHHPLLSAEQLRSAGPLFKVPSR
jgi:hypothetical protein